MELMMGQGEQSSLRGRPAVKRVAGSVVDIFCGAGGLTHGFRMEGFDVVAGIDVDETCRYAYERNNEATFIRRNVALISAAEIRELFYPEEPTILIGCAPCQPFSKYNQKNEDPKWQLVDKFADMICEVCPDIVSMENVPRLIDFQGGEVFKDFIRRLENAGYHVQWQIAFLPGYGVPQMRSRLVLLASRHGPIHLEPPSRDPAKFATVGEAIGELPPLEAGGTDPTDPLHCSSGMSSKNLARIRQSVPGGSWKSWDEDLIAACHRVPTGKGYRSVYGRMSNDKPSPTITTQFFGFGNGRFGHPTQDRGLSLREGALLQSFPQNYEFVRPGHRVQFKTVGRMIGNAVPVSLARAIARTIHAHCRDHNL